LLRLFIAFDYFVIQYNKLLKLFAFVERRYILM
jgi:hypothetical protein